MYHDTLHILHQLRCVKYRIGTIIFKSRQTDMEVQVLCGFFLFQIFFGLSIVNSPVLMPTKKNLSILTVSDIIFLMKWFGVYQNYYQHCTSGKFLAHSVECWILNLEAPGSIPAWGELFISTFPLSPVTFGAVTRMCIQPQLYS